MFEGFSSSDTPPPASYLWGPMLGLYYVLAISSDSLLSSDRPMAQHINLGPYPHSNLRHFSLHYTFKFTHTFSKKKKLLIYFKNK